MTPFPRDDYRALTPYDPGRRPVSVDLSDNTNLWGPHPDALAMIRGATPDDVRGYPEVYADALRTAVSERFGVPAAGVTTGAGSDDVLDSAFRAASEPGAVVTYPAPTFSMIGELALMNGMVPHPVAWAEAMAEPERLLDPEPALVYLCSPNNPTGALAPEPWIRRLLELRGPDGPLVVVDEAYADFSGETLLTDAPSIDKLLVTRTASKALGLAGLRCGFAVGSPETVLEVEKSRGPYKVSRLAAAAAAAALRDENGWMARVVAECLENRERLRGELSRRNLTPLESSANFLLLPAPSGSAVADMSALREDGVAVRPFAGIPGMGEGLRVTVGPWPLLEKFLQATDRRLAALREVTTP